MEAPQIIDIRYKDRRHWFEVWRYTAETEFFAALIKDGIKYDYKDTVAYTDCYMPVLLENGKWKSDPDECGRMYLLNKSIDTLAHEATHMALGILARHGISSLVVTTDEEPEISHDLCKLVGPITSQLFSKQRYY